jgi:hypothetical protein
VETADKKQTLSLFLPSWVIGMKYQNNATTRNQVRRLLPTLIQYPSHQGWVEMGYQTKEGTLSLIYYLVVILTRLI